MGWLGDLLKKIGGSDAADLIFVSDLKMNGIDSTAPIVPDECYVQLVVESLRLERARRFASTFHGVVYSFVRLSRLAEESAVIAAISKPPKLAELDSDAVGKVITVSKMMMGAVPWRGGQLGVELGLFSVKSGNVLTPVVNFVSKVSETAGISFVGTVKPFVPLITEGMDLIAGQTKDSALEVGIDTSLQLTHPMACAIIAAKKGSIDLSRVAVDGTDGKLLLDGQPLKAAYCVFSVRATDRKPDFGDIPELKQSYAAFRQAVLKGVENEAKEALQVFRRTAITSPDLIPSDARKLIASAETMMRDAFGGGGIADHGDRAKLPETLADVRLYD